MILDCYTDPLGWKSKLANSGRIANDSLGSSVTVKLCKNVKDLDELLSLVLNRGKGNHTARRFFCCFCKV